jgi:hypothetical protein
MTTDALEKITAHFISHWGVPNDIRERKIRGAEKFAVLEFAPRGTRTTWRYATNGMSSYVQNHSNPEVKVRTEMIACTSQPVPWIGDLLGAIASYPTDYTTSLAEGDTIAVGQAIDRSQSPYTGVLFAPPGPIDPASLGVIGGLEENVLVHQLVGLLPAEVDYAEKHTGKTLWKRLVKFGEPLLDRIRG